MDPEEVTRLVTEFKLSTIHDSEDSLNLEDADVKTGAKHIENCLVAKVLFPKSINREAFKIQMPRILQASRQIEVGALGDNRFLLDFKSVKDKNRALYGSPWNFFRDLIIFCAPTGLQNSTTMPFNETSFWVQCYNLPLVFMNREALGKVGNLIGEVEEIDTRANGLSMGRYARIRVCIDVSKPLNKFVRVSVAKEDEDIIVLLAYERLPDFCYNCGCLGHSFRDCESPLAEKENFAYGSWMKASYLHTGEKIRSSSPRKSQSTRVDSPLDSQEVKQGDNGANSSIAVFVAKSGIKSLPSHDNLLTSIENTLISESSDTYPTDTEPRCTMTGAHKKWKRRAREKGSRLASYHNLDYHCSDTGDRTAIHTGERSSPKRKRALDEGMELTIVEQTAAVANQPADHYELHILECSGAWEPTSIP